MKTIEAAKPAQSGVMVIAVHPNGHVERITTRQEFEWARAEGLHPFLLGPRDAIEAIKARAAKADRAGERA